MIPIIHRCNGFVFLTLCDNLRANQSYRLLKEEYGGQHKFSIRHPVPNSEFPLLYTLYDPTHLFKNIRNNWVTVKMKTLDFTDPSSGQIVSAKWSHLVDIFGNEIKHPVKLTKLSYSTLYPTNFEKQKVSLAMNVNEKTVTVLDIRNYHGTKVFVEAVTRTWHMLIVKTPYDGTRLNDTDRTPINDVNDERLNLLLEMGNKFLEMDTSVTKYT